MGLIDVNKIKEEMKALNAKQKEVVNEIDRSISLLASAGTGKTNTLALRIANIIESNKASADEILCLTFTNRACKEMKERVISMLGKSGFDITVRTFHSFCFDVIKTEGKRGSDVSFDCIIFDEQDCIEVIDELGYDYSPVALQRIIDLIKPLCIDFETNDYEELISRLDKGILDKLKDCCRDEHFNTDYELYDFALKYGHVLLEEYNLTLRERHALDFNDLLIKAYDLFKDETIQTLWSNRYKYIHIDEVQDTSTREYKIISKLFSDNNVMICGDYFQTIYEWRGSCPKVVLESFKTSHRPVEIVFDENYRSTQTLLDASYGFLKNSFGSEVDKIYGRGIKPKSKELGDKIRLKNSYDIEREGGWIFDQIKKLKANGDHKIAILTRNNRINIALSEVLGDINSNFAYKEQIPFFLVDEFKFFRKQEIKDILAYLKFISNKYDANSLKRILSRFAAGIGEKTIDLFDGSIENSFGLRLIDMVDENTHKYKDPYKVLVDGLRKGAVIVFDVEATGVDTLKDEIIQIAAVKIDIEGKEISRFVKFLKPTRPVGDSEMVHGFSDEFLKKNGEDSSLVLREFSEFIRGSLLVAHNIGYDLNILESQLGRLGLPEPQIADYFDTLDIVRRFYPNLENHKLETLCRSFRTSIKADHDALHDILATQEILLKIVRENIEPTMADRISAYSKHLKKFAKFSKEINELRAKSLRLRPHELIGEVISVSKIYEVYKNEEERLYNIEEFCEVAKYLDENSNSCHDALLELLKTSSLSNTELDRIQGKNTRIPIITVHQAKGAEFDYVFMAGLQENVFPSHPAILHNQLAEEKRVFYVGMTRARKQLMMSWSKKDYIKDKYKQVSSFISMVPREHIEEV